MAASAGKDLADSLSTIRADIAALGETVGRLVSDTAGIKRSLVKTVGQAGRQASAAGEEMLSGAGELAADAYKTASRSALAVVDEVEGRISRNPFTAIAIALGIGVTLGLLGRK